MKCIYCSTNTKYKARSANGGRCASCGQRFAFNDKSPRLTDELFRKAIADSSDGGVLRFTPQNLRYAVERRLARWKKRQYGWFVAGGALVGLFFGGVVSDAGRAAVLITFTACVVCALVAAEFVRVTRSRSKLPDNAFQVAQGRWRGAHGEIANMISPLARQDRSRLSSPATLEEEEFYSFERAVVTQTSDVAQLLVENNFHFDNECAVLSYDGYPERNFSTILAALQRNHTVCISVVHDASGPGCDLPWTLREGRWFPEAAGRIVDVGLRPRDVSRHRLSTKRSTRDTVHEGARKALSRREIRWIESGKSCELMVLPPKQLPELAM